jgi:hypothetical protein
MGGTIFKPHHHLIPRLNGIWIASPWIHGPWPYVSKTASHISCAVWSRTHGPAPILTWRHCREQWLRWRVKASKVWFTMVSNKYRLYNYIDSKICSISSMKPLAMKNVMTWFSEPLPRTKLKPYLIPSSAHTYVVTWLGFLLLNPELFRTISNFPLNQSSIFMESDSFILLMQNSKQSSKSSSCAFCVREPDVAARLVRYLIKALWIWPQGWMVVGVCPTWNELNNFDWESVPCLWHWFLLVVQFLQVLSLFCRESWATPKKSLIS